RGWRGRYRNHAWSVLLRRPAPLLLVPIGVVRVEARVVGLLGPHLVGPDEDGAGVAVLLAHPRHLPVEDVAPRAEEVVDEVLEPLDVVVELLPTVADDRLPVGAGHPLAPQARLPLRWVVDVPDCFVAIADVIAPFRADRQADGHAHRVGQRLRLLRVAP